MSWHIKIIHWIANKFPSLTSLAPFRAIGFILFVIAWISGEIGGWLAWGILLLFIDWKIDIIRNK